MSRHDYRISICFSDEAVATLVAHWNPINLGCQGPMRTSQLRLTPYQLTITYKWTLPVSMQQVMILLSIRQFANKKKRRKGGGRLETVSGRAWRLCFCFLFSSSFNFYRVSGPCEIMYYPPWLWFNCYQQSSRSITEVCLNFIRRYNLCYFPTVPNKP